MKDYFTIGLTEEGQIALSFHKYGGPVFTHTFSLNQAESVQKLLVTAIAQVKEEIK